MATSSGMIVPKNKQGIFDRQLEMCATFVNFNYNNNRVFNYSVDNSLIEIIVFYDKICDWSCETGKKLLIDLIKHYKLHLLGYELQKVRFITEVNGNSRYKHICKYRVPLTLIKFDSNIFFYNQDYLTYKKIERANKFKLF